MTSCSAGVTTCRVCLSTTGDFKMLTDSSCVRLVEQDAAAGAESLSFFDCFAAVMHFGVDSLEVGLPQHICVPCSMDLGVSYKFLKRAQEADLKMRTMQQQSKRSRHLQTPLKEHALTLHEVENCGLTVVETISRPIDFAFDDNETSEVECKVCKRLFPVAKYVLHFRKVHADAPDGFQCTKCPKRFAYRYRLKAHLEVHHGVRQKNVPCPLCSKLFYSKKLLNTHLLSHTSGDIRHKCEQCGKGFQRLTGLRRHMIMHAGGREECLACGKRFPNPAELRIHMLTHTKETPFLCAVCGQGFRRQGPLSYHMRKHRGEKYVCAHCAQEFSCLSSLRRHEYKHVGLPFKCPRCALGQATRGSLERHMKEAHQCNLTADELRSLYSTVQNSRLQ